jgi:hypothetical protein
MVDVAVPSEWLVKGSCPRAADTHSTRPDAQKKAGMSTEYEYRLKKTEIKQNHYFININIF